MDGNMNNQNPNMGGANYQQPYQQQPYQQQPYQQPYQQQPMYTAQLKTDRAMWKVILFNIITCGIYSIIFYSSLGTDINTIARRRDGKETMHYCLVLFLLGPITCNIFTLVWFHGISQRIGDEARARGIYTDFGSSTYWLWGILGSLILVGPFIYTHKLCTTMNQLCETYNRTGC